ncbi:MAG: SMP-30/gluconolactonase/LRE family protein [Lacunisphaera sp.]
MYRLGTDGKITLLISELARPNGVALSPDEKTLYLGSTDDSQPFIKAYPLNADGSVGAGRVFYEGTEFSTRTKRHGGFDGLKVDAQGNIWTSGPRRHPRHRRKRQAARLDRQPAAPRPIAPSATPTTRRSISPRTIRCCACRTKVKGAAR